MKLRGTHLERQIADNDKTRLSVETYRYKGFKKFAWLPIALLDGSVVWMETYYISYYVSEVSGTKWYHRASTEEEAIAKARELRYNGIYDGR